MAKRYRFNLPYYKGYASLSFDKYAADGSTSIHLYDPRTGEPLATATVCLEGSNLGPEEVCIKSWSENAGMVEELARLHIIGPIKRQLIAGYAVATVHDLYVRE